jgi:porin
MRYAAALLAAASAQVAAASRSVADEAADPPALAIDLSYVAEVIGPVSGGLSNRGGLLDNLSIEAAYDLDRALGWRGGLAYLHLLNNSGDAPNDYAGTLEGVSNIEVGRPRAKVFEAWIGQELGAGAGSIAVGLYDLNRDFYATEAAGLLMAPPFGIGSEVASTGPNGPSIFPSTAAGVFWRSEDDRPWRVHAAVVDAEAGVLGDPDGVQADFDNGAIALLEAGVSAGAEMSVGFWRYSDEQPDVRLVTELGDPVEKPAFGVYAMAERRLAGGEGTAPAVDGFLRLGMSDGDTTAFSGGFQTGVLLEGFLAARPDAQASLGLRYAQLSGKAQDNFVDAGGDAAPNEWGFELTYADPLNDWLTLQPDLQVVFNPGGDGDRDALVVLGLRAEATLGWGWR